MSQRMRLGDDNRDCCFLYTPVKSYAQLRVKIL